MKTLTFFAILLIVTFVNTNKSVSYSEVAQSLVQLHANADDGLAQLSQVAEGFAESHKSLESVRGVTADTCSRLNAADAEFEKNVNRQLSHAREMIGQLAKQTEAAQGEIEKNALAQKSEVGKITAAGKDLKNAAENLVKKESELSETMNVLLRLKNIAQDELAGKNKINTEMGQYKVVNNHGVSFIQKSNLSQELKTIMSKSETAAKSLISTLIMMAANDDGHYSDPKIVGRVIAVLDKIIDANRNKVQSLQNNFNADNQYLQEIIDTAKNMIMNLAEATTKNHFMVELFNKETNMFNRDVQYFERSLKRRQDNNAFHRQYCKRQAEMMETYQNRYAEVARRVSEMRAEFGQ